MNDLRTLPLTSIITSSTRAQAERRAHFDQAAIAELAESIKTVGLLSPLVVRPAPVDIDGVSGGEFGIPTNRTYEIVAGERRFLAAQLADLEEIPCSVRELTDEQVLEVQLIENLQRADLHELVEAEGYEALQQLGHSVEEIAAKVGKSKATVYARCKLLALVPEVRTALRAGKLSASVALLIARIPADCQHHAMNRVLDDYGGEGDPMSYRDAQDYIHREYTLRLDQADFDKSDEQLVPAAGSCWSCPKRSGTQPELFPDIQRADVCTDRACFATKREAHAAAQLAAARKSGRVLIEGEAAQKIAPYGLRNLHGGYLALDAECYEDAKRRTYRTLLGDLAPSPEVLVCPRTGDTAEVIREKDVRTLLKKAIEKPKAPKHTDHPAPAQRKIDKDAERQTKLSKCIFRAIFDSSPTVLRDAANFAAADAMQAFGRMREICEALGWDEFNMDQPEKEIAKLSNNDVARLLRVLPLSEEIDTYGYGGTSKRLLEAAKAAKVNVKLLEQQLDAELAPKASPASPAAKKKPAKKADARRAHG